MNWIKKNYLLLKFKINRGNNIKQLIDNGVNNLNYKAYNFYLKRYYMGDFDKAWDNYVKSYSKEQQVLYKKTPIDFETFIDCLKLHTIKGKSSLTGGICHHGKFIEDKIIDYNYLAVIPNWKETDYILGDIK